MGNKQYGHIPLQLLANLDSDCDPIATSQLLLKFGARVNDQDDDVSGTV